MPLVLTDTTRPTYRSLLGRREFVGLYTSFTVTTAGSTMSGFALGSLVHTATGSPLLTAIAMYGSTFAVVLGALTLMSVADGGRPRATLLALQVLSLAGVASQAWPGLPIPGRFAILVVLGFVQSLSTGVRMGLLAETVPLELYALARSLMNVTSGGASIVGFAVGGVLLTCLGTSGVLLTSAGLAAVALTVLATTVRERSVRLSRRPGLSATWRTNRVLFARRGPRALLVNLWVPNGLIVGCEGLLLSYDSAHAATMLAAGSAGMLVGDLTVGRLLTAAQRRAWAYPLRLVLATPFLAFAAHPGVLVGSAILFVSSAGFAATLPLQERLLALTPEAVRGQVQGVESAGRIAWQGIGAIVGGAVALAVAPATSIATLALASVAITVATRGAVGSSRALPM
ncbi:MFS transporter [Cellulomonas alba]|uniref:MFS transporter n=1 Tax=Cellulomonas alba TaxID=3053467 RepID=A0ABT7SI35_9CELL|nr:MFS transporter [Cellulomonas alba]MDM7855847.1 hypothetical protein [Cellulomonas alba]